MRHWLLSAAVRKVESYQIMNENKSPLRVCIYTHSFYPNVGGIETFTANLCRGLTEIGIEIALVTKTSAPKGTDIVFPYRIIRNPSIKKLLVIIKQSDILHLNTSDVLPATLGKFLRKKIVWTYNAYSTICPKGIAWNGSRCSFKLRQCLGCLRKDYSVFQMGKVLLAFPLRILASWLTDQNVPVSQFAAQRMNLPRTCVIPNSVDPKFFSPKTNTQASYFSFLGRLIREKGADVLVKAANICIEKGHSIRVRIYGEGPEKAYLIELVQSMGLEEFVSFHNFVRGTDLVRCYNNSAAIIVPSLWDEVCPILPMEAMSCGTPVIASAVGGLAEVVDYAGLLFEAGNAGNLADKMIEVLSNAPLREKLAKAGRERAITKYDYTQIGERYLALYKTLLE